MRGGEKEGGSPGSLVSSPLACEEGHDPARAVGRSTGSGNQREWHPGTRTSPCTPYIQEGGAKKPKGSKINDPHRCAYSHMDGDEGGEGGNRGLDGNLRKTRLPQDRSIPCPPDLV